jgi:hypothetical protein
MLNVKMKPDTMTMDVSVKLRDDQFSPAANIRKGDRVTFQARLVNWDSFLPLTADQGVIVY